MKACNEKLLVTLENLISIDKLIGSMAELSSLPKFSYCLMSGFVVYAISLILLKIFMAGGHSSLNCAF
jgi:hypothetical protein